MTKPFLLVFFTSISLGWGADPDVQRALDDALKRFPPGDYRTPPQQILPQVAPEMVKQAMRRHPAGTLPWLRSEVDRLNGTLPELPSTNPFERPVDLLRAPTPSTSTR